MDGQIQKPKIYLETTMFNFPFADDAPQLKADTNMVFDMIDAGKFEPYTSIFATFELQNDSDVDHQTKMLNLIPKYKIVVLRSSPEAHRLALLYINAEAIPVGFYTDALHIAMTTCYGLDFIISLNFQHIVREWTIKKVAGVNAREGYKAIGIYKPAEVLGL